MNDEELKPATAEEKERIAAAHARSAAKLPMIESAACKMNELATIRFIAKQQLLYVAANERNAKRALESALGWEVR